MAVARNRRRKEDCSSFFSCFGFHTSLCGGKEFFLFSELGKKNLWLSCLSFHIFVWNAFYYANTAAKYAYTGD